MIKIMLSVLERMFEVVPFKIVSKPKSIKIPATATRNGKSIFLLESLIGTGDAIAINPRITSMLKRFEPTMFPTDISMLFETALVMLTESSGKLVPRATIVRPMKSDGTLRRVAMALAPETKKSAPLIRRAIPKIKNKMCKNIVIIFSFVFLQNKKICSSAYLCKQKYSTVPYLSLAN